MFFVITAIRVVYAQQWRLEEIPLKEKLMEKILNCIKMDKLTGTLHQEVNTNFIDKWKGFCVKLKISADALTF